DYIRLITKKRAHCNSRIPVEWHLPTTITSRAHQNANVSASDLFEETDLLSDKKRAITENHNLQDLLSTQALGYLRLLLSRALSALSASPTNKPSTNCLTEIFFDKALEQARICDAYLALEGRPMGVFNGLQISLKDSFMVKGEHATMGFASYLTKPAAEHDSVLVDLLRRKGSIFCCKTSESQLTSQSIESKNAAFGCTLNPHNPSVSPSGSSSGEAALIALHGSPLGVGTDVGGSIRSPALCTGLFGFKPSSNRLPYAGQQALFPKGYPGEVPPVGPLAQSARHLTLFCKAIVNSDCWKSDVP
ncbi:amidase signature domain-containing protein, partial [Ilyonectria destructans]